MFIIVAHFTLWWIQGLLVRDTRAASNQLAGICALIRRLFRAVPVRHGTNPLHVFRAGGRALPNSDAQVSQLRHEIRQAGLEPLQYRFSLLQSCVVLPGLSLFSRPLSFKSP